jgi:hypothetical protein
MTTLFTARLHGTQEEMGAQHGALVAAEARALLGFYRTMPERALAGGEGEVVRTIARGFATAMQARLHRERPAELVARSRAFARAAGLPEAESLRTLATMDSLQNAVALAARAQLGPFAEAVVLRAAVPACSTVIAWGDATAAGELVFARNFDFPGVGVWDAAPAFIVCAPDGGQRYGFFATKGADAPVVTVVNEAGLVIAPHTRWHRGITIGGAMIVDLVHEIARKAEGITDAIRIARARPASSSWGIAIGSAREKTACVLELAGPLVEVVRPAGDYLVCANRYRSPAMQAGQVAGSHAWAHHSDSRDARLRALVDARTAPLTPEDFARFLGDRNGAGIRRELGGIPAQPTNVHAAVVQPLARRALVGVDRAPSCEGTWAEVRWSWDAPRADAPDAVARAGFVVTNRDDLAAPHSEATRHVHVAVRAYEHAHDVKAARGELEQAVAAAPEDPSLRLAAAWLALEDGHTVLGPREDAARAAIAHVRAALPREPDVYRRGQLLLWGSRAARRVDPAQARRWLEELDTLPGCEDLQARRRHRGRPRINLMMVDAY